MAVAYPMPGKVFADAQGRTLIVEAVDKHKILLRVGIKGKHVLVISWRSWGLMGLVEQRRAS